MASASSSATVDLRSEPDTSEETASSPAPSGSEGTSLDASSGDLKEDIWQCLHDVRSPGTFASFGTLEDFIDPQVYVDGQPISLPLSEDDAQRIIKASHRAPFGKGSETIVDLSVRNTWEINRGNFQLRNPEWQSYMRDMLGRVTEELGISHGPDSVRAELYKMLLYEKGAMFKPHTE
jgi:hypothetical protein